MTAKKCLYMVITVLVLSGMVSCSSVRQDSSSVQQDDSALASPVDSYIVEKEAIMDIGAADGETCVVTEQYIYYIQAGSGGESKLWRQELAEGAEAALFCTFAEYELVQAFAVTDAGNVIAAVRNREQGNTELRKLDRKGEMLWECGFPEGQEDILIFHILVGDDGRNYISGIFQGNMKAARPSVGN